MADSHNHHCVDVSNELVNLDLHGEVHDYRYFRISKFTANYSTCIDGKLMDGSYDEESNFGSLKANTKEIPAWDVIHILDTFDEDNASDEE